MLFSMPLRILDDDSEVLKVVSPSMLVFTYDCGQRNRQRRFLHQAEHTVNMFADSRYPGLLPAKIHNNVRMNATSVKSTGTTAIGRMVRYGLWLAE